ncbi:MAG: hypothetical protein IAE97_01385 [Chthoniobacterales bacterium]|nr:hypothetical protein [Chthoniobacterales bacterium]
MKTLMIQTAGVLHFAILIASALTPHALDWRGNLAGLHPFMRRLFWVYGAFIVLVIAGFGVLTLLNAEAMASGDPVARSLGAFIAVFWLARLGVQWFVFDARPFLTNGFRIAGYHALTCAFIGLTIIYGWVAIFPAR